MKVAHTFLITLLLISTITFVNSIILDRIHDVANKVGCELHKVGNKIRKHEHHMRDPCENNVSHEDYDPVYNHEVTNNKPWIDEYPSATVPTVRPTVPQGKRLISVGSNCPEGYRADRAGNCREAY